VTEHTAEFELGDGGLNHQGILADGGQGVVIAFHLRQVKQLTRTGQVPVNAFQDHDDILERLALFADVLRLFGVVPELGVFGETNDLV